MCSNFHTKFQDISVKPICQYLNTLHSIAFHGKCLSFFKCFCFPKYHSLSLCYSLCSYILPRIVLLFSFSFKHGKCKYKLSQYYGILKYVTMIYLELNSHSKKRGFHRHDKQTDEVIRSNYLMFIIWMALLLY